MSTSFPYPLSGLLQPAAYPHPVGAIELIETQISWVLLTGDFAYKLKRPVKYPFVDLTSGERREFCCREELRLNRRFAPLLYIGVCAVTAPDGVARIGGGGRAIEFAVKMHQFQRTAELDSLLAAGGITPAELGTFGADLAAIHAHLPVAQVNDSWATPEKIRELVLRNLAECSQASAVFSAAAKVEELRPALEQRLDSLVHCMSGRRAGGYVRECHGDLHAGNVVRQNGALVAFDCMEFEPNFRWIDVADEIAFLLSDLGARGYPDHAYEFLAGYLAASADYQAVRLLPMYQAHRALVRAKVCALNAGEPSEGHFGARQQEWGKRVGFAATVLAASAPRMLLMHGPSGSGKTWLARALAPRLRAVYLSSDVERKRRAAGPQVPGGALGAVEGLYTAAAKGEVYSALLRSAEDVLAGGVGVIVDATFGRRDERQRFAEAAQRLGVQCRLVACEAPLEVLQGRITARVDAGTDASDADLRVLDWQLAHHDVLDSAECTRAIRANTREPHVLETVCRQLERE